MERIQNKYLFSPDIHSGKMIFLFGPRQVGKTTLALKELRKTGSQSLYFNWDDPQVKRGYIKNPHFLKAYIATSKKKRPLIVFDEIHKQKNWKNILKGLYDIHLKEAQFLITGSARLDYFRNSGDSLVGRYFSYRLLPLGLAEATGHLKPALFNDQLLQYPEKNGLLKHIAAQKDTSLKDALRKLMLFGGFPEPFLKAKKSFSTRWRKNYTSLLIYEDLRDLTRIQDMKGLQQLLLLLPERVGSPLSINALREDLQVNHKTAANWIDSLTKIYLVFSIMPWSQSITKAIKKETKLYFWDWTMVDDPGPRFENLVAVALSRMTARFNELGLGDFALRYVRNQKGQEVDFLVIKNNKPFALFEAKSNDTHLSKSGITFSQTLNVPYYQIVAEQDVMEAYPDRRYVLSAWKLLALLG